MLTSSSSFQRPGWLGHWAYTLLCQPVSCWKAHSKPGDHCLVGQCRNVALGCPGTPFPQQSHFSIPSTPGPPVCNRSNKAFLPNICNHLCIPRPSKPQSWASSAWCRAPEPAGSVAHLLSSTGLSRSHSVDHGLALLFLWLLAPGSWLLAS